MTGEVPAKPRLAHTQVHSRADLGFNAAAGIAAGPDLNVAPVRSRRIEALFRQGVVAFAIPGLGEPPPLLPAEAAAVERADSQRRREFAAGRACGRAALGVLGQPGAVLPVGPDRRPVWPPGVIGSITHTAGLCGAAVARCGDLLSLGLDAQAIGEVDEEIWPSICTHGELARLIALAPGARQKAAALVFTAKEAFFKAHFEITAAAADFTDVVVRASGGRLDILPFTRAAQQFTSRYRASGAYFFEEEEKIAIAGVSIARNNPAGGPANSRFRV